MSFLGKKKKPVKTSGDPEEVLHRRAIVSGILALEMQAGDPARHFVSVATNRYSRRRVYKKKLFPHDVRSNAERSRSRLRLSNAFGHPGPPTLLPGFPGLLLRVCHLMLQDAGRRPGISSSRNRIYKRDEVHGHAPLNAPGPV